MSDNDAKLSLLLNLRMLPKPIRPPWLTAMALLKLVSSYTALRPKWSR